jgi:hypothetical protein
LIIHSPGAEEVSDIDLAARLGELQTIAKETPGLQILVASANGGHSLADCEERSSVVLAA